MRMDFETANPGLSYDDRDRLIKYLAGILLDRIRRSDTLGRVDTHTFGLILPHIALVEGQRICERLWDTFVEETGEAAGKKAKVFLRVVELSTEVDKTEDDVLGRATMELLKAMESGDYRNVSLPDGR